MCEDSPFGKNSAVESIRLAAGIISLGDIEKCQVLLLGDAIFFLNKNVNASATNMDSLDDMIRLIELSELHIIVALEDLIALGLDKNDLISYQNLDFMDNMAVSKLILENDLCFKF
ncbi:MAG: DsrE family protein [Promethearchaeota archaeon]